MAERSKIVARPATDGRPRGRLRAFELSRLRLREYPHKGCGVTTSSW